jgi:hypothetical protein
MDTLVVSSVYGSVVASVVATATTATTATIPFATMTPVVLPTTTRPTTTIPVVVVVIVHPPATATATPFLHDQRVERAVDNTHRISARLARGLARIRDDVNTSQRKNQN